MRPIDFAQLRELQSRTLSPFGMLRMTVDETEYAFTECDVPLGVADTVTAVFTDTDGVEFADTDGVSWMIGESADATLYQPRGFESRALSYSTAQIVDRARISVDNLDDMFTSAFIGGTPQGSPVTLSLVTLDSNYKVIVEPVTLFEGTLDSWSIKQEGELELVVTSLFAKWKQRTIQRQVPSCRWKKFKGPECGYTGNEDWCDRSYKRCQALGNTANFGGNRWLPSIQDKAIWWGRTQG
jgi:hypothetical protein